MAAIVCRSPLPGDEGALAVILVLLSRPAPGATATRAILLTITLTFLVSSILSAVGGRMRHFSWWVLLAISALVTASLW